MKTMIRISLVLSAVLVTGCLKVKRETKTFKYNPPVITIPELRTIDLGKCAPGVAGDVSLLGTFGNEGRVTVKQDNGKGSDGSTPTTIAMLNRDFKQPVFGPEPEFAYVNVGCDSRLVEHYTHSGFKKVELADATTFKGLEVHTLFLCGSSDLLANTKIKAYKLVMNDTTMQVVDVGITPATQSIETDYLILEGKNTISRLATLKLLHKEGDPVNKATPIVLKVNSGIVGSGSLEIHSAGVDCSSRQKKN